MRILAKEIHYRFPGYSNPVLAGVTLGAAARQMLAVTGPSGSGKSTLLSIMGLILKPDSGTVSSGGEELVWGRAANVARASLFGWVTQTSNVFGSRTVLDNVAISLFSRGLTMTEARRSATAAVASVGLEHRLNYQARILSGGELQRLTVARVIAAGKPIILADEPTGQLDRANTGIVVQALRAAASLGAAVVVATHDPVVAQACDECVRIVDGHTARSS